ncbi:MAG: gene transfer agent family protein [Defluviitaleaceae bacterium]|nr:gene transfer agent family protein [Defluviitaleaceae bacterium]
MKSFHNLTIGGQDYKLRLTASAIMAIEKKLGKPLFAALENIESNMIETIATILWGAMKPFNTSCSFDEAVELLDLYVDEGHTVEDLIQVINALFEGSSFFGKGQAV